jgi:hypothetical protein
VILVIRGVDMEPRRWPRAIRLRTVRSGRDVLLIKQFGSLRASAPSQSNVVVHPGAGRPSVWQAEWCRASVPMTTTLGPALRNGNPSTAGDNGSGGGRAALGSMTFSEASLIARDLSRTVSGPVIKPGDTSCDEARRPFNLRMHQPIATTNLKE